MPLTHYQQMLSLIYRADQLVTEADEKLAAAENGEQWVATEDLREMLVEMRARMETWAERIAER